MKSSKNSYAIYGKVSNAQGKALAGLKVEVYAVGLRAWQALGSAITDAQGKYTITWEPKKLDRDKKTGNFGLKVFSAKKQVEVYQADLVQVSFDAKGRYKAEVRLTKVLPVETPVFNDLRKQIKKLAGEVAIAQLKQDQSQRDVSFLAKALPASRQQIEWMILAHQLEESSEVDAAFFYAVLQQETLLHHPPTGAPTRRGIDLDADPRTLLYDIALVDETALKAAIHQAVEGLTIAPSTRKKLGKNLEQLAKFREEARRYYQTTHPKKSIDWLVSFLKPGKLAAVQRLFKESQGNVRGFIEQLKQDSFFVDEAAQKDAQTQLALGQFLGLGNEAVPAIAKAHRLDSATDVKQLARLNKADWVKAIGKANPALKKNDALSNYASLVVRRFEQAFPTIAFAAQLEREKKPVVKHQAALVAFLNAHPDFDFLHHQVDLYLKEKQDKRKGKKKDDTLDEQQAMSEELKALQRVFRLAPHYGKTLALRQQNMHSAFDIVGKGKTRFLNEIAPKAGLSEKEAHQVYQKAQTRQTAAMLMLGNLKDQASVAQVASFKSDNAENELIESFPDLQTLFGVTDSCECQHCRSVYSPAAYLVEILQFLEQRAAKQYNSTGEVIDALVPPKNVLFERRPDLGEIDLSCANANVPVKYIDLVCELLEEAIAPTVPIKYSGALAQSENQLTGLVSEALLEHLKNAGLPVTAEAMIYPTDTITDPEDKDNTLPVAPYYLRDVAVVCRIETTDDENFEIYRLRQTLSTTEALAAAPEYVNDAAYEALRNSSYAFALPFDLHHTEAQAYFSRFGVQRADLMEAFRTLIETDAADEEAQARQRDFVIACERLGLTEAEANLIVTASSDEATQQAIWNVPEDYTVLGYLAQVDHFLDRTGLSYGELELLLKLEFIDPEGNLFIQHHDFSCDLTQKEIVNLALEALDRIHRFLRLQKKTGWEATLLNQMVMQAEVGIGFLDDRCLIQIARINAIADKTKWRLEALTGCFDEFPHTIYNPDDPKPLYYQIFLNEARNGSINEDFLPENVATGDLLLDEHGEYIATCLQITTQDIDLFLSATAYGSAGFGILSELYTASLLMKTFGLSAQDFLTLFELAGLNEATKVEGLLKSVEVIEAFEQSPLSATEVKYLLEHEADNLEAKAMSNAAIATLLEELTAAYQEIEQTYASQFDSSLSIEEQQATFLQVVSAASGASAEAAQTIYGFVLKEWETVEAAKDFVAKAFDEAIDLSEINIALDALAAVADDADSSLDQLNLLEAIFNAIATFQINTAQRTALLEVLAEAFKTDADLVEAVLASAQLGEQAMAEVLMGNFANATDQENALQLLHKMLYLIDAFGLDSVAVTWLLQYSTGLGGFALDALPYNPAPYTAEFEQYLVFLKIANFIAMLSPVANPVNAQNPLSFFSLMESLLNSVPADWDSNDFFQDLALLTGYEKNDLIDVAEVLFANVDAVTTYQSIDNLEALLEGAEWVRKLGMTVEQMGACIQASLGSGEVSTLRAVLKARYDEDTWLTTLEEIMDAIRPQKRDALVAYLLAYNPDLQDSNDLYDQYLIDVEMGACMPSSRIVQAHNSVQLFVQRCLMGLEPAAIADVEADLGWKQWEWMKNYRVWEANRKVFLYPENWYEVSLTSDPSYLLTECLDELQQNELTNDTAEQALTNYLEKLDDISFLQVAATWYDVPSRSMHVFARTKGGDPAIYYYRRFEKERYWTPWEKIEVDITGDHLLAFVRNNRLHLAWLMFSEEPDPDPKVTENEDNTLDKPKRKLKMQLALSVYSNEQWQPKRVSKEAILTPNDHFTAEEFHKEKHNLAYIEASEQIYVFKSQAFLSENPKVLDSIETTGKTTGNLLINESNRIIGVFDLKGCKGYPEVAHYEGEEEEAYLPEFYPDFNNATLQAQKYQEATTDASISEDSGNPEDTGDALAVRNINSPLSFMTLLAKTPDRFTLAYPHQVTAIDVCAAAYSLFLNQTTGNTIKLSLGAWLPYFKEDSNQAYVIVPGFYKKTVQGEGEDATYTFDDSEKVTVADLFDLWADLLVWSKKMVAEFEENPPENTDAAIKKIVSDADFQALLAEIVKYEGGKAVLSLMANQAGSSELDEYLKTLEESSGALAYGEQFKNLYHPLVCALKTTLYADGVAGLMQRDTQLQQTNFNFERHYAPNAQAVPQSLQAQEDGELKASYPIEDLDFSSDGSYSVYNWDLFFRIPLHIAGSLSQNQRFEEALQWFHYIFNPTGALEGEGVQKYWVTKPFYLHQTEDYQDQSIEALLRLSASGSSADLEFAIAEWRAKPFEADVVARYRPVAYQKAVLMQYLDNLIAWGDYLFRQDTMESITQATQMYILADKLLGAKPKEVKPVAKPPYETYNQLATKLGSFGNALIAMESILPDLSTLPEGGEELPTETTLSMLYFCVPTNEKMLEYWDIIADRLFKIRHCQNIDGVERSLALFAPPIDPGMLVRTAAAGLDIASVIAGLNAPLPHYRFRVFSQKATELAQEVRSLGNALLQALEKRDAEALSLLRNQLELKVLDAVTDIKQLQIEEAEEQIEVLNKTRVVTEERHAYYRDIEKMNKGEKAALGLNTVSAAAFTVGSIMEIVAGATSLIPEIVIGVSGVAGTPVTTVEYGGNKVSNSTSTFARSILLGAQLLDKVAGGISTIAGYNRRYDDWKLQETLADKELESIDQQIVAAELRKEIAETDLKNHELQIENAHKTDEFMRNKFTNKELYDWMVKQITAVYFKAYQLAHDFAKKAERCYQFELGNSDTFIAYGYWDSLKKGLQSANHLMHDIKRMETSYLDKNKRAYQLTKHVSLAMLDPLALQKLKATGVCDFSIPEALYDMDHAGQYFRRIKSVSISLPCIAGPYTSVSAKLSLVSNKYRKDKRVDDNYREAEEGNDMRFAYNIGAIQSIATSHAQNDSGMFELNFNDERYLPFEGTGAIGTWRLELPEAVRQFDYNSIADVVLHVKYTAREGGSSLKNAANATLQNQLNAIGQALGKTGLHLAINLKHDMPNEWHLLKNNGSVEISIDNARLPYMAQAANPVVEEVMLIANDGVSSLVVHDVGTDPNSFTDGSNTITLNAYDGFDDLKIGSNQEMETPYIISQGVPFMLSNISENLEELVLVVGYGFV
ncbi:neuraminidase-like domain-containing protein [uncultured Microscilla sp.]|uniref:Tc toxin subunit A-related protein n=1 Tax=uncultured Microscilla sp. TaxID=432653 RepID=UPI0026381CC2|nr:neuraminidase-like domain-containing protein [uncultured Microscilla sp.]